MTKTPQPAYTCLIGFDYAPQKGGARRFEPGEIVSGIPAAVAKRLIEANPAVLEAAIAPADAKDAA